MKRFKIVFVLMLALFALSACAPVAQKFVDLPASQEVSIKVIVSALLALVFDWAIGRFPWLSFFRQYQEAWSLLASGGVIVALENALPTGSDAVSVPAVTLLIAVALYFLGRTLLKRNGVQGFV